MSHKPKFVVPAARSGDLNVTPLIDVVLVLLIIFMVTMPLQDASVHTAFAESGGDEPPAIGPIWLSVAAHELKIDGEVVAAGDLPSALKASIGRHAADDRLAVVDPTDDAPYQTVIDVMTEAKRAGATSLALPEP